MARTTVTVECKTVAVLACSADERLLVFLNRELVGDFNGAGSAKLDDFKTTITLENGANELSLISTNTGGEWGAFVRLLPQKINHEYSLNYHLKPLPPGIADVPSATMIFLDSRGSTITEYEVSAWRDPHNSGIAVYKCYFYSELAPVKVGINVAVPYMQDNFVNRLPFIRQYASIGRPGNMAVWGKVVDISTGAPVPNATVTIVGSNEQITVSCVDGLFRYESVDPAYSMIEVRANGYWPDTFAYDVNYLDAKIFKLKPMEN